LKSGWCSSFSFLAGLIKNAIWNSMCEMPFIHNLLFVQSLVYISMDSWIFTWYEGFNLILHYLFSCLNCSNFYLEVSHWLMCSFDIPHQSGGFLFHFIFWYSKCSVFILYISSPSSRTRHFSKLLWLLTLENVIRNQEMDCWVWSLLCWYCSDFLNWQSKEIYMLEESVYIHIFISILYVTIYIYVKGTMSLYYVSNSYLLPKKYLVFLLCLYVTSSFNHETIGSQPSPQIWFIVHF
jgi:hypothetical protein